MTYQPRYVAYAHSHGRTPEEQDAAERHNYEFIAWIQARWREWCAVSGACMACLSNADHDAFDAWLAERYPAPPPREAVQGVLL